MQSRPLGVILALIIPVVLFFLAIALTNNVPQEQSDTGAEQKDNPVAIERAAWDAGNGRPEAAKLTRGASDVTVTVPQTLATISTTWDTCASSKRCRRKEVPHYPLVYKIGRVSLKDNCFTGDPQNPVDHLMIASTTGGSYTATYTSDGRHLKLCSISPSQDDDQIAIWSDAPTAER